MKKYSMILAVVFMTIGFFGCSEAADTKTTSNIEFVEYSYDEDWEECGVGMATYDGQPIYSLKGESVEHTFNASASFDILASIKAVNASVELGYSISITDLTLTGTSEILKTGHSVNFYYRPIYRLFKIKQDENEEFYKEAHSVQYAVIVRDTKNNKIKDTTGVLPTLSNESSSKGSSSLYSTSYSTKGITSDKSSTKSVKNGFQVVTYENGKYSGYFKDDQRNGYGKYEWNNSAIYEGDWENDMMTGKGIYTQKNGNVYSGNMLNGKYNGYGVLTYKNGGYYEGNFLNDLFNGQGKIYYSDGNVYTGNWVNGNRQGMGKTTYTNGYYEGAWSSDKQSGYGEYHWNTGDIYKGNWKNGDRDGSGIYYYSDGSYDIGIWVNGTRHGLFKCYDSSRKFLKETNYLNGTAQ